MMVMQFKTSSVSELKFELKDGSKRAAFICALLLFTVSMKNTCEIQDISNLFVHKIKKVLETNITCADYR